MSNPFRDIAKQKPAVFEKDLTRCEAYDCPCRASVNLGSGWVCSAHSGVPVDRWAELTRGLQNNKWLIDFIDEMRKMDSTHQDWRGFAEKFWNGADDFCKPHDQEEAVPYQNRMRFELIFRAGGTPKRPPPHLPKPVQARGHFAERQAV